MKPRDWFGLGVRFTGLWCLMQSATNLLYFLDVRLGFSSPGDAAQSVYGKTSPQGYVLYAAGYSAIAFYFLLCTEHLTRWTFNEPPVPTPLEIEPESRRGEQPEA
jgi:hypothetical protein